jgi:serine/threonine protein kinase
MVEGPTLAEVLGRGALGAVRTMDVVAQVAAGLQAAHAVGLVHRDITPANILFAPDGTVKITDFGIAHAVGSVPLTATGTVLGTPGYIAPERVCGYQTGPASDLYALGIVAYECLTGARPFVGPPLEVAIAHRDRPLPALPASVPGEVAALVMMLTAKDPAWRPSSAGEVADRAARLREALAAGPLAAGSLAGPAPTAVEDSRRFAPADVPSRPGIRRALVLAAAGAAAIIGLVVLSVMITSGSHSPAVQPSVSQPSATPSSGARPSGSAAPSRSSSATRPASARSSAGAAASPDPATSPAASSAASQPGPRQHKTGHGHGHGHGHG